MKKEQDHLFWALFFLLLPRSGNQQHTILIKSHPSENVGLLFTLSTRRHPFIFVAFDPEIPDKLSMKDKMFVSP